VRSLTRGGSEVVILRNEVDYTDLDLRDEVAAGSPIGDPAYELEQLRLHEHLIHDLCAA